MKMFFSAWRVEWWLRLTLLLYYTMTHVTSYCSGGYAQSCTTGYAYYVGDSYEYCYMAVTSTQTWYNAKSGCESSGGWLVTIHSSAENTLVNALFGADKWIGLNDLSTEGTYTWLYGSSSYYSWATNEPNNYNGGEDCIGQYAGGTWNDFSCTSTLSGYVCQITPSCSQCLPNTYSSAGDNTCSKCPGGKYSAAGSSTCNSYPTVTPTRIPTITPTLKPTVTPTRVPTVTPTRIPTVTPTLIPTTSPTVSPTLKPSQKPTSQPTSQPSR